MPCDVLHMTLYSRIFENIPDAVLVIEQDGTIRHANRQAEAMFAFTNGGLVGRSVDQLLPARFSQGHSRHRDGYLGEPRAPDGCGTRAAEDARRWRGVSRRRDAESDGRRRSKGWC